MSKTYVAAVILLLSALASPATAQLQVICPIDTCQLDDAEIGTDEGLRMLAVELFRRDDATIAGLRAHLRLSEAFVDEFFFGLSRTFFGNDSELTFFGGGAVDLNLTPLEIERSRLRASIVTQLGYTSFEGGYSIDVPVGLGFATDVPLSATTPVGVYVIPEIILNRISFDDFSDNGTDFGIRGGAAVHVIDSVFGGAEVRFYDRDPHFGIRAGFRL